MRPAGRRPSRQTAKRHVPLLAFVLISASLMTPSVSIPVDVSIHIEVNTYIDELARSHQRATNKPKLRPTRSRRDNCAKGRTWQPKDREQRNVCENYEDSHVCVKSPLAGACNGKHPSLAADVYSYGTGRYIAVDGEIIKGDLAKLTAVYERIQGREGALVVDFNSPGGDLDEAIAMGRWIRHAKASTGVRPQSSCASACVYIFAAGVDRFLTGPLIIHRPYLMSYPTGGVDAALKGALAASRSYFAEMNVPERLADVMFSISPDSGRLLTPTEIDEYQLSGNDMATEEDRVLKLIKKLGISRLEYMRRLHEYQRSPELAHCLSLQGDPKLECARKATIQYGIDAGD